jgi:glycerol-3-phosphate acyltransferase PlsY
MIAGPEILAAAAGYLAGSIPFALLVVRLFGRGEPLRKIELTAPGAEGGALRSSAVSATAVRLQLGARYGCLTGILDMAKAAAVTLVFKLAFPGETHFLIASGMAVVGHIWPIFHRFRGGRGQSSAIGGLFVVDWPAPLIAYPLSLILGLAARARGYVDRFAPMVIAAGWLYFRFEDLSFVYYALGICLVRNIAMRYEIKQYVQLRKAGALRTLSDELKFLGLDTATSRAMAGLRQLWTSLKRRRGS